MTATVLTLFNEFPLIFILRVGISGVLLFTLIALGIVLYKNGIIDKIQRNSFIVLSSYTVALLYFTVLGRYSQSYYRYETDVFASYKQLFESFDVYILLQIMINLAMFIPVGFLLCLLIKSRFKYFMVITVSLVVTTLIEILQFVSRCGTFEADDLVNNIVSSILGIVIYIIIKSLYKKRLVL